MDLVKILRELFRLRRFVAIVAVLAVLAGLAVEFQLPSLKSRSYEVGTATASILVDTPSSQVVALAPKGSDTTAARADLLASLMVDGVIKALIAQQAGLKPSQLSGETQAATVPAGVSAPSTPPPSSPYMLTTQVPVDSDGNELPIIQVNTQAPTRADAAKLANAAITGLAAYLNSKAAVERITDANRLEVTGMGVPQAATQAHGPTGMVAMIVVLVVFFLGCGGILAVQALVRGWRAASIREQLGDDADLDVNVVALDREFSARGEEPAIRDDGSLLRGAGFASRGNGFVTRGAPLTRENGSATHENGSAARENGSEAREEDALPHVVHEEHAPHPRLFLPTRITDKDGATPVRPPTEDWSHRARPRASGRRWTR